MTLARLAGNAVARARVQIPAWGLLWADIDLVDAVSVSGPTTLEIGGVEIACAVVSGGTADGRAGYRVTGGAGGWGRVIPRRSYRSDLGVRLRNVLADAAIAAGEAIADVPNDRLGPHYARAEAPAAETLNALAPRNYYVDFQGVTRYGSRPASVYGGEGARVRVDPAVGVIEIATEDLTGLVPGVSVDGSAPASDVEYELTPDRLVARVYYASRGSRRLAAWARLFDALDPRRRYRGVYEFRVATQTGDRFGLQPVRASSGFEPLSGVPVRGPAGYRADVTLGETVLVAFVDADPSRPCIITHDEAGAPGWAPELIELGGTGGAGVALEGGLIDVSGLMAGGNPVTGIATIAAGSAKVKAVE